MPLGTVVVFIFGERSVALTSQSKYPYGRIFVTVKGADDQTPPLEDPLIGIGTVLVNTGLPPMSKVTQFTEAEAMPDASVMVAVNVTTQPGEN